MTARSTASQIDDPLGLASLEATIEWSADGPLPSWLDGADLPEEPNEAVLPVEESPVEESRIETLAEVGDKTDPRVDVAESPSENRPPSAVSALAIEAMSCALLLRANSRTEFSSSERMVARSPGVSCWIGVVASPPRRLKMLRWVIDEMVPERIAPTSFSTVFTAARASPAPGRG